MCLLPHERLLLLNREEFLVADNSRHTASSVCYVHTRYQGNGGWTQGAEK